VSRRHVVVVNDDPIQLRQVAGVLRGADYEVSAFLDAAEALAGLSGRLDVHLFVVDLHMPGIDGWKLCRLLRSPEFARFNETPILVVSATFTGDDVAAITRELGADAFLEAPFDGDSLLAFAGKLLAGEQPRMESLALIVEDDASVRSVLARTFRAHGYQVVEAANATEAREAGIAHRFDLVLLDYHLPDGSCERLLEALQARARLTCALVMTGDTDPTLPVRLLARGADGYLRKPFDPAFAVEMAGKARRERSLLRIESILEARTHELRSSEERYRTLFDTIPDLVLVVDQGGHVQRVNPEALSRLGVEESALVGRHVVEVVAPDETRAFTRWLDQVARAGAAGLETVFTGPSGVAVPVELSGRAIDCGETPGVLMVGRDLTERRRVEDERRRLEAQMQHAQRLESLGVLAGGVAHDFNNLLVGILGNASLALMDLPVEDPVRDSVHQIELAARRAAELTQQILAFAGRSKVSSQEIRLTDLIREMGQLMEPAVSKKAHLSLRLPPSLPVVQGDPGQIRQVVMNLLMNASDSLEGRPGTITVSAGAREVTGADLPDLVGGPPTPGSYVFLEVVDTGCGMDDATLARIFEPFFTTKFTGRGLGLASTLGIVRAHAGMIAVRSAPGQGTRVTVFLPARGVAPTGDGPVGRSPRSWWSEGGRVLIVDDEPAVRALARATLVRQGFTVEQAGNGAEALDALGDHGTTIDLVLMDVTMPELNGPEALAEMRRFLPRLPVLVSSGYPPDGVVSSAGDDPATAFLRKPYGPAELMDAVSALLRDLRTPAGARGAAD
jgi:PAS domain S-box-containing protein